MAGDANEENTDTSSIKPVSSLRSRFENLNTDNARPPPSPVRSTSRLSQYFPTDSPSKASLDVQRPVIVQATKPLPTLKSNVTGSVLQTPTPVRRPQNEPRPPRPVSVGPASPPAATPVLTIQSPQSPPRPAYSTAVPSVSPSPPRPRSTGALIQPLAAPPLTDSSAAVDRSVSPNAQRKPGKTPPPVNRAAKPIVAPAPAPIQTSLAPQALKHEEDSVSPFSTPPDSPASNGSPRKVPPQKGSYFPPPPPIHHQVQARRQSRATATLQSFTPLSQGRSANDDPFDQPERRPSLPARIGQAEPPKPVASMGSNVPNRPVVSSARTANTLVPAAPTQNMKPPVPEPRRSASRSQPPMRPSEESKEGKRPSQVQGFLPPPKRIIGSNGNGPPATAAPKTFSDILETSSPAPRRDLSPRQQQIRRVDTDDSEYSDALTSEKGPGDYPDITQANRRPPKSKVSLDRIWTHYDTRLFDICGKNICTSGYITRAWDITTGKVTLDISREEREVKVLSMVFKPGASADEEGQAVWLGDNYGEIQELDLGYKQVVNTHPGAHGRHDIVKMHRYQNTIWSIDADGKLLVWLPNKKGIPDLDVSPDAHRVSKGHTFSIIARDLLWFAAGKDVRVYDPASGHERSFNVTQQALSQPGTGDITSGATVPTQLDRVYFGHSDGKVSIYSTENYRCLSVVNVSNYKITTMAGVGSYIWAGFSTGFMYVYDMNAKPWKAKKEWKAHDSPVASIVVDRSSVWKFGQLQVVSIGLDNAIKFWDGMLDDDWVEEEMHNKDVKYCEFREIKTVIVTWNAGAATPMDIRYDQKDENFFREVIQPNEPPDILVFGFQELVDLEDKGLTAKNLLKGRHKNKANQDPDHMGRQYRAWRDFLVRNLEENMPLDESYSLVQTGNLVGLFSCIFIKSSQRSRIRDVNVAEVKRGMGGLYGNKGAIIIRFVLDSTSLCFVNCHLAAGQKETLSRNNDATAILEAGVLEQVRDGAQRLDAYTGGGDGTMIMDHEIGVINGDLNYRIDTMGRDSVVKAIKAGNIERLLDRDQLLLSKRRNPMFKLRNFKEEKITFAPTYKYDVRTDRYDSSEKHRSPAWCDRILYRGQGRMKMLEYRRHECWASDHRPVSGTFRMRIKNVIPELREETWQEVQKGLVGMKMKIAEMTRLDYLVNVLGVSPEEAKKLAKT